MNTTVFNRQLYGVGISAGFAMGTAYVRGDMSRQASTCEPATPPQTDKEYARFQQARDSVLRDITDLIKRVSRELDAALIGIFRVHRTILRHPVLSREIKNELEDTNSSAEQAVQSVLRRWKSQFESSTHYLLQDRADDIEDLNERLLCRLLGVRSLIERVPRGAAFVTQRLLPSEIVLLHEREISGIVVESCGSASHAAILARSMGIPIAAQIPDATGLIASGDLLLIDGIVGRVVTAPDQDRITRFQERIKERARVMLAAQKRCTQPALTRDDVRVLVMANAGCPEDVCLALDSGADGIGLFRLEQFYMSQSMLPCKDHISALLRDSLRHIDGLPMTVRLLDVGADKVLPYLRQRRDRNPLFGRRGVRLLIDYPELLSSQLQAILVLSQEHPLRVLVPMVTIDEDMRRVREAAERAAEELGIETIPPLGAMIETPAAALCIAELSEFADFFSIGTNDLTQYTMAAGREEESLSDYYVDDHPAIIRLIQHVCSVIKHKEVSVCGELAGNPEAIPLLLRAGIRMLSVVPLRIPAVKERVRSSWGKVNAAE